MTVNVVENIVYINIYKLCKCKRTANTIIKRINAKKIYNKINHFHRNA